MLFSLYNDDSWGLDVYASDGSGLILAVTSTMIQAIEECPESNSLIASDDGTGIALWRLADSCQFRLIAPTGENSKVYIIIFDVLYGNSYYESHEEFASS